MRTQAGVHFETSGSGEPSFVMVHGFACAGEDWRHQMAALSADYRCVTLDLPGHGASAAPSTVTMAALGRAVNEVRRAAGAGRAILVGHSLGVKIIREAYADDPDGIAGLVLIDGAFYDGDRAAILAHATGLIDAGGFAAYARAHFASMFVPGADPALKAHIVARATRLDPAFGRALYLEAVGWDPLRGKASLAALKVPVLVLQSTHIGAELRRESLRPGMKSGFMRVVEEMVPQAVTEVVPDAGHFTMIEAAEAVNRRLRAFAAHVAMPRG